MVLFNYSTKELTAKVVYYGPGLCGKTTNLQWIHEKLPIKNKGKMLSLATETDRTLFFDFLPIELGMIRGMKTRIQLYTVPGQVFYNATRRMVLKGADCVVFVADSQDAMLDANAESLDNLKENLEVNDISLDDIPLVIQYNKRDLPNALPVEQMNARLNPRGVPWYEAVAVKGVGVEDTLKGVTGLVFKSLAQRYGGAEGKVAAAKTLIPQPNVVPRSTGAVAPRPAPLPAPPPSAPPPAPPPPLRATGSFSPSDLLDADPLEVAPEDMPELDLEPLAPAASDPADMLEELTLDELGPGPSPPDDAPLELELDEPPPFETVEEFSPLSELEDFMDPPASGGAITSPFGTRTQPGPADADDPLASLGFEEVPAPDGGFDPSALGSDDAAESLDAADLLELEAPPVAAAEAPAPSFDPASFAAPEPDLELDLPGLGGASDADELDLGAPSDAASPELSELSFDPEPAPDDDPFAELAADLGSPPVSLAPPRPQPTAPEPPLPRPAAAAPRPPAPERPSPTAPFPAAVEEDDLLAELEGSGPDPEPPGFDWEPEPPAPPPPRAAPLGERPAPLRTPSPAPVMAARPAVVAPAATATIERSITPTTASVALAGGGAENDITIPVEVTLGPGGATQVNLNIRLTLNFKLQ